MQGTAGSNVVRLLSSLRASKGFDRHTAKQLFTLHDLQQSHVSDVYEVAKQKHSLDHDMVKLCLSYYSRNGNAKSAYNLIEKAKADGVVQHNSWYSSLAGALAADGDIPMALQTLQQAKGSFDPHTMPSLVTKISTPESSVRGYLNQFFKIIRDTVEKPERLYYSLMNQFAKAGDVENCTKLYAEMKKHDVEMGVGIYNTLLIAHKKKGDMATCMMLLDEMKQTDEVKPNLFTYNVMIDGFGKLGDMTSCQSMLKELQEMGYKPDVVTYSSLLGGYSSMGDLYMCNTLRKMMKEEGIAEDIVTFYLLLKVNEATGRVKECEALFKEMQALGIQPNEKCLDIVQRAMGAGNFRQRILVRGSIFAAFLPQLLGM